MREFVITSDLFFFYKEFCKLSSLIKSAVQYTKEREHSRHMTSKLRIRESEEMWADVYSEWECSTIHNLSFETLFTKIKTWGLVLYNLYQLTIYDTLFRYPKNNGLLLSILYMRSRTWAITIM